MINRADPDYLLLQKPTDLDLYYLQKQGISQFSRTRVNINPIKVDVILKEHLFEKHSSLHFISGP